MEQLPLKTGTASPLPRRKGGQPGNQNARKHGIYSRYISVRDSEEIVGMSNRELDDELNLARIRLVNALHEYQRAATRDDLDAMTRWDASIRQHIDCIAGLKSRILETGETEECIWTSLMDAVRAANDKQGTFS